MAESMHTPRVAFWRLGVLMCVLFAVAADAIDYLDTYVFELTPYPTTGSAPRSRRTSPAHKDPLRALTTDYQVVASTPFFMDTGGTIDVSLSGGGLKYNVASYYTYVVNGLLERLGEVQQQNADTGRGNQATGATPKRPNEEASADVLSTARSDASFPPLFLTHPRLYCMYVASNESAGSNCSAAVGPPKLSTLLNADFVEMEALLQLMIFDADTFYRITEGAASSSGGRPSSLETDEGSCITMSQRRLATYSLLRNPSLICSAPAMYTIPLNALGQEYVTNQQARIRLIHQYPASHLIAVLAQCSAVPLSITMRVTFDNNGLGSIQHHMALVSHSVILTAYLILLISFLIMILRCGRTRNERRGTDTTRSTRGGGDGGSSNARSSALDEPPASAANPKGYPAADASAERRGAKSIPRHSTDRRRPPSSAADVTTPGGRLERASQLDSSGELSATGASASSTESDRGNGTAPRTPPRDSRISIVHGWTVCSRKVRSCMAGRRRKKIMYPPMQWVVLSVIVLKCLVALLGVIESGMRSGMQTDSFILTVPSIARFLEVSSSALAMAFETLVGMGWGLAYTSLTLRKRIILGVISSLAFIIYSGTASCTFGEQLVTLSSNSYANIHVGVRCMVAIYARTTFDLFCHLLNTVYFYCVTYTLGHRVLHPKEPVQTNAAPQYQKLTGAVSTPRRPRRNAAGGSPWLRGSSNTTIRADSLSDSSSSLSDCHSEDHRDASRTANDATEQRAKAQQVKDTNLYLRYRGLRGPFMLLVVWALLYIIIATTLFEREDYYMEVLFTEFQQLYLLTLVILFFSGTPFYP